ncbi:MAG: M1 family metallopeptidase [Sciscionella sp.]
MARTSIWHRPMTLLVAVLSCVGVLCGWAAAEPPNAPAAAPAVAGSRGAGGPYYPEDGNGGYRVSDYQVSIRYDPTSHQLAGEARITASATERLRSFDLDLSGLTVHSVTVNGGVAGSHRSGRHELVINPSSQLPRSAGFTVDVRYSGIPKPLGDPMLGLNGWQYSVDGGAFAAGEPHSAATWYPVNDTPRDKASFHLTATVPVGWSVIGNGRQGHTTRQHGWHTYRWNEDTPIASYLTTIGIDKWIYRRSTMPDGTPIVSAFAPSATRHEADEARLPEILAFLESKFGPYPQDAAGGIFLADNIGFSLETQTRPVYGQWAGLSTIVHENAHQWFGDSVTVHDWRDTCLNECFASYAQSLWAEAKGGVNLDDVYRHDVALTYDQPQFWAGRLYDAGGGKEFTSVYAKGAMAIHALRRRIGERAFDVVLRGWPARYRNGNASWPEFERFVQRVSGQHLQGFFNAWFHGTTIPQARYLWPGSLHP